MCFLTITVTGHHTPPAQTTTHTDCVSSCPGAGIPEGLWSGAQGFQKDYGLGCRALRNHGVGEHLVRRLHGALRQLYSLGRQRVSGSRQPLLLASVWLEVRLLQQLVQSLPFPQVIVEGGCTLSVKSHKCKEIPGADLQPRVEYLEWILSRISCINDSYYQHTRMLELQNFNEGIWGNFAQEFFLNLGDPYISTDKLKQVHGPLKLYVKFRVQVCVCFSKKKIQGFFFTFLLRPMTSRACHSLHGTVTFRPTCWHNY